MPDSAPIWTDGDRVAPRLAAARPGPAPTRRCGSATRSWWLVPGPRSSDLIPTGLGWSSSVCRPRSTSLSGPRQAPQAVLFVGGCRPNGQWSGPERTGRPDRLPVDGALGCIDLNSGYRSIGWQTIVLIVGMLPFSIALQRTGGVDLAADALISPSSATRRPPPGSCRRCS